MFSLLLKPYQKVFRIALIVVGVSYVLFHLLSLNKSPYPWFDETFMVSIAKDWAEHSTFTAQIANTAFRGTEVFIYGPVYFLINGFIFKIVGITIFNARIVCLLAYFAFAFVGWKILRELKMSVATQWVWIIGILTEPNLSVLAHQGRMETLVILFLFLSFYFLIIAPAYNPTIILSGFFFGMAALTSPRIGFIVIPYGCFILYQTRSFWKSALWISPVIIFYGYWVFYAFGSLDSFIKYYTVPKSWDDMHNSSFIFNQLWYVTKNEIILLTIALLLIVTRFFKRPDNQNTAAFIWLLTGSILAYFILINNWGPYMTYSLVLLYLWIACLSEDLLKYPWITLAFSFLLLFNLAFYSGKITLTLASWNQRNPSEAKAFFQKHIPEKAKVVGDPVLYYIAVESGNSYEYFEHYESLEQREKLHREVLNYDYLVVSDIEHGRVKEDLEYYIKKGHLKKVAAYKAPAPNGLEKWIYQFHLFSEMEKPGYGFEIWEKTSP